MAKVGRNEPCPCNSGRKYKHCCFGKNELPLDTPAPAGKFVFEPGSYGDAGHFMSSLLCYRKTESEQWEPYYCLVKPDALFDDEDSAVTMATEHLKKAALAHKQSGNPVSVALVLRKEGYKALDEFHIVPEDAETP
ncbi:MAG TPA: SEC-C metal-binding domain-containing protein [Polyangium sp.]|nr:SEC-C metal-binding domain-containing protein [Polyangium sp.]